MKRDLSDAVVEQFKGMEKQQRIKPDMTLNGGKPVTDWVVTRLREQSRKRLESLIVESFKASLAASHGEDVTAALCSLGDGVKDWLAIEYAIGVINGQIKISKRQRTNASQPRKLTKGQQAKILRTYDDMVRAGDGYGAIKFLAREHNISRRTVETMLKDREPH